MAGVPVPWARALRPQSELILTGAQAEKEHASPAITADERLRRRLDGIEAGSQQQGSTDGTSAAAESGKMKKAAEAAVIAPFCPCGKK
jgi:hypothetical protein